MKHLCLLFLHFLYFPSAFSEQPSVIIVGAGAAGIAAATKLWENSITNITILEAENRIGGRIHTVEFGGGIVELGAEFCDGTEDNILYDLAKDLDLLSQEVSFCGGIVHLYYSNGSRIEKTLSQEIGQFINNYGHLVCTENNGVSVGDGFLKKYKTAIQDKYINDPEKIKIVLEAIKLAENAVLTMEGTPSWDQPSARKHNRECRTDRFLSWKGKGFQVIFDILTRSYPNANKKLPIDNKIKFNKKVTKISWNHGVNIETSDSSSYFADYVIFTPSMGVLTEEKDFLFHPQLPKTKLDAMEAIGYATMMKVFLHFERKWWKNEDIFFFLWNDAEEAEFFKNKPGEEWITQIPFVRQVGGNPNVLTMWIGGSLTPYIEKLSNRKLLDGCNFVIKKFLGKAYNVTSADKLKRTQWHSNLNFRGTYSYEKKEYFHRNVYPQKILSQPLNNENGKPVVLFGGEATHPYHYGTVQGAIQSGYREAERIISLHKDK